MSYIYEYLTLGECRFGCLSLRSESYRQVNELVEVSYVFTRPLHLIGINVFYSGWYCGPLLVKLNLNVIVQPKP